MMVNIARDDPAEYSTTPYTTSKNKTVANLTRNGELVDVVIFAFVAQDGSWLNRLTAPTGDNAPPNQVYHALNVYPLNGEYQRALAFLHYCFAPVNQKCQMFTVSSAWQAATMWGNKDTYKGAYCVY